MENPFNPSFGKMPSVFDLLTQRIVNELNRNVYFMEKGPNYIAVYRRKLIDDQIIKPNGYAYVSFLLSYFDKFVEQEMISDEF